MLLPGIGVKLTCVFLIAKYKASGASDPKIQPQIPTGLNGTWRELLVYTSGRDTYQAFDPRYANANHTPL